MGPRGWKPRKVWLKMATATSTSWWSPSTFYAFQILLLARIISSFYNNINDADETYNYWEPAHFFMHGSGFQTWEYSPVYGIRSYSYILLHVLPLFLVGTGNKIVQFYSLRVILAIVCCFCEAYFYRAIKNRLGSKLGLLTLFFLIPSSGMFISSTAFLPSSFAMYCLMVAMATWLERKEQLSIMFVAISAIVGWPFAAVLGIPIAFDVVFRQRRFLFFVMWSFISLVIFAGLTISIDYYFYGKLVFPPLNIILYNIFSKGGPNLYGTEPWTFYFANGFLNFNFVFLLALISWPLTELKIYSKTDRYHQSNLYPWRLVNATMFVWIAIFFTRPHKEERFLFPIYPLFCLTAAMSVLILQELASLFIRYFTKMSAQLTAITKIIPIAIIVIHGLLGVSRSFALYNNYSAPIELYTSINSQPVLSFTGYTREINVCVGKEWHRFPTNYFLPDRIIQPLKSRWHLRFIQSDFKGQLPKQYSSSPYSTRLIPSHMNDMNKEEPTRYFDVNKCHFLVDLELPSLSPSSLEPRYSRKIDQWETLYTFKFLDPQRVGTLLRAFYIPGLSGKSEHYGRYLLLRNKKGNFVREMPKSIREAPQ